MIKVVTNRCFGGFGLSNKAEVLYMAKQGKEIFRYDQTKYMHRDGVNEYTKIPSDGDDNDMCTHTYLQDYGDSFNEHPDTEEMYWSSSNIKRDDPILIEVVEELGEEASGRFANLQITEIPDGTNWAIHDYDGSEHVEEVHNTW